MLAAILIATFYCTALPTEYPQLRNYMIEYPNIYVPYSPWLFRLWIEEENWEIVR